MCIRDRLVGQDVAVAGVAAGQAGLQRRLAPALKVACLLYTSNSDSGITTVQIYGVENLTEPERYACLLYTSRCV